MGTEDYTAVTGGSLKLKGVKGSRIEKPKKKKKKKQQAKESSSGNSPKETAHDPVTHDTSAELETERGKFLMKALDEELARPEDDEHMQRVGKTEAERRHEERRRKRVSPCSRTASVFSIQDYEH